MQGPKDKQGLQGVSGHVRVSNTTSHSDAATVSSSLRSFTNTVQCTGDKKVLGRGCYDNHHSSDLAESYPSSHSSSSTWNCQFEQEAGKRTSSVLRVTSYAICADAGYVAPHHRRLALPRLSQSCRLLLPIIFRFRLRRQSSA